MHKLLDYVCKEMEELERKVDKDGKLSMAEMQYMDVLAHTKKNLLKSAEMMGEEGEYSMMPYSYRGTYRGSYRGNDGQGGGSYARRRDSMGRYSRNGYSRGGDEMVQELRELMQDAPDDRTRQEFERFISKIEQM